MTDDRRAIAEASYERHWGETLARIEALVADGDDLARVVARLDTIDPATNAADIARVGYRVAGATARGAVADGLLENLLFEIQKMWLIRRAIPADATDVVELGSGSGRNLFKLWLGGLDPRIRLHAFEYTAAGRRCAERLASLAPRLTLASRPFDYYAPDLSGLAGAERVFVFTSYSIEQITKVPSAIFDALLALPGLVGVLHVEPVGWQYGAPAGASADEIDVLRRMMASVERKGYNRDLVRTLRSLAVEGRIAIDQELPNFLAHRPDLPGSAILWRPRR